jgi:hypothetical protein
VASKVRSCAARHRATRGESGRRDVCPAKNLLGIPWRVAFALQDDGWTLRNAVIWAKPNAMPESVTDRLSTRYEHVFLLSKSRRYWFDLDAIREPLSPNDGKRLAQGPVGIGDHSQGLTGLAPQRGTKQGHDLGRNPGDVWTVATMPPARSRRRPLRHHAPRTRPPALGKAGRNDGDKKSSGQEMMR